MDAQTSTPRRGGVFRSINNGETWELLNSGLTNQFVTNLALSSGGYLYAGARYEYGHPLFRSVNPIYTSITPNSIENESIQVYPNPFSSYLTIQLAQSIQFTKSVEVEIYNAIGSKILQKALPMQQQLTVNLSALKPGVYIVKIKNDGKQLSKRIIKATL